MLKKLLATTSVLVFVAAAGADITGSVDLYYQGAMPDSGTYVYSYNLNVTVTGADSWICAGGPEVGIPWINLTGGTFFQSDVNDADPPDPDFFVYFPDSEYTSFYATHLSYPNTADQGAGPGFAYGPADTPTALNADWFWTPDGNFYPGTFTIARFTAIIDDGFDQATLTIDMLVASVEVTPPFQFEWSGVIPAPGSLALLALGGLALIRRR